MLDSSTSQKTGPLPVVDLGQRLSSSFRVDSTHRSLTQSRVSEKHKGEVTTVQSIKSKGESDGKGTHPAETITPSPTSSFADDSKLMLSSCDPSSSASSDKEGAQQQRTPNSHISGNFSEQEKLGDDARGVSMVVPTSSDERISVSTVAEPKDMREANKTPPLDAERDQENVPAQSPVLRPGIQEIPSSADSTQDDMTLAEMKSLIVNRLGLQEPRASGIKRATPPTERSLAVALDASKTAEDKAHSQATEQRRFKRASDTSHAATVATGIESSSLNRCVPLTPIPSECSSTLEEVERTALPDFSLLVNFPQHCNKRSTDNITKLCVMCGQNRPYLKKRSLSDGKTPFIHVDAKGVCSSCETAGWVVKENNLQIKWCQQRAHFQPLVAFMDKGAQKRTGVRSTCVHCRDAKKERARARKEKKALRLEGSSAHEVAGTIVSSGVGDSSTLGKRPSDETTATFTGSTPKRVKLAEQTAVEKNNDVSIVTNRSSSLQPESDSSNHVSKSTTALSLPPSAKLDLLTSEDGGISTASRPDEFVEEVEAMENAEGHVDLPSKFTSVRDSPSDAMGDNVSHASPTAEVAEMFARKELVIASREEKDNEVESGRMSAKEQVDKLSIQEVDVAEIGAVAEVTGAETMTNHKGVEEETTGDMKLQSEQRNPKETVAKPSSQRDGLVESVVAMVNGTSSAKTPNNASPKETVAKSFSQEDGAEESVVAEVEDIDISNHSPEMSIEKSHSGDAPGSPIAPREEVQSLLPALSDVTKDPVSRSDETELAASDSSVNRHETPGEKGEPAGTAVSVASDKVEAEKRAVEAESPSAHPEPEDEEAEAIETSMSAEKGEAEAKSSAKEEESSVAIESSARKAADVTSETKRTTRRTRSARKKDSLKQIEPVEEEQLNSESPTTPAKRTRKKPAPKQIKPEQEKKEENEDSLTTPAKKRTSWEGYSLRGSSRKRTRSVATPSSPEDEPIRVIMTGVDATAKHKKMIVSIGGVLLEKIEDAHTATHVIAGDNKTSLRRTPKLMIGMCRTSKIVDMNWLVKSVEAREALQCDKFLLLHDKEGEKKYDFVMRQALQRGDTLRHNDELLLSGHWVYVCNGVAGNKAPPEKELELIVDAAGGKWLSSVAPRVIKDLDKSKLLIITQDKPVKKKAKSAEAGNVDKAIKCGAQVNPASWLFQCIIRQSLSD